MPRKKKKEEGSQGSPLWMTTFADMITLVLTFFILLYSYSNLDVMKWKQMVISVKGSLGVIDGGKTLDENNLVGDGKPNDMAQPQISNEDLDAFEKLQREIAEMEAIKQNLRDILESIDTRVVVDTEQRGVVLRFQDSVLFEKGKAYIKKDAKNVLIKVAEVLKDINKPIRIEGHTDDLPINTPQFPSNWELSAARSINVLKFLLETGLNPQKLSAVGYGEYYPLVPNLDENSRKKNRRVDIVIIKDSISIQEPDSNGG